MTPAQLDIAAACMRNLRTVEAILRSDEEMAAAKLSFYSSPNTYNASSLWAQADMDVDIARECLLAQKRRMIMRLHDLGVTLDMEEDDA